MATKKLMKKCATLLMGGTFAISAMASSQQAFADEEKETLVIGIQTSSTITDYKDNYLTKVLEDELGVDLEFYLLSADPSELRTQLSLMASANQSDMPDIICTEALTDELILEYGSKGAFVDLTDLMSDPDKTPNFNAIESEEDKEIMLRGATSADGKIYSMVAYQQTSPGYAWNLTPYRVYMNQKWLDTLGLSMPTTTDELYETLKAFAEQDPNGNGVKDEIPLYGSSAGGYGQNITIPLMNYFIFYPATTISNAELTLDETGTKVIAPFVEDGWRKGLEYMNKLCSEGLLSEATFTDDVTQMQTIVNNEDINLVGCLSAGSTSMWINKDYKEDYEMLPVMENPEGTSYAPTMNNNANPRLFVTSNCADVELAVKLGDLFYRHDICMTARYGEEGENWTDDEEQLSNDAYSSAYVEAGLVDKKSVLITNDVWGVNNNKNWRYINPGYFEGEFQDGVVQAAKEYDPTAKDEVFKINNIEYYADKHPEYMLPKLSYLPEEATEQAEVITNVSAYVSQSMAQFITGARPLNDNEWESYKEELEDMGLSIWLENAQTAYDRMK